MKTTNFRKVITLLVACAVLPVHSLPVSASSTAARVSMLSDKTVTPQTDDDDDGLSGGALAVLLLAVDRAVAGVLYAALHDNDLAPGTPATIAFKKNGGEAVSVTLTTPVIAPMTESRRSRDGRRATRIQWSGRLDPRSGEIRVSTDGEGGQARREWIGKVDGSFHRVTGARPAREWSFNRIDPRSIGFASRQAGRGTRTGRIAVSAGTNTLTFTITNTSPASGRPVSRQITYEMRK